MTSDGTLLYPEYVESYHEAHRRASTLLELTSIVVHKAYYHPRLGVPSISMFDKDSDDPQYPTMAHRYFGMLLDYLSERSSGTIAGQIVDKYVDRSFPPFDGQLRDRRYRYVYEGEFPQNRLLHRCRLEFHREYVCFSWFIPIFFEKSKSSVVKIKSRDNVFQGGRAELVNAIKNPAEMLGALFETVPKLLNEELNPYIERMRAFSREEGLNVLTEPQLFADFYGVAMPWTAFAPWIRKEDYPAFAETKSAGFDRSPDAAAKAAESAGFLRYLWTRGLEDALFRGVSGNGVACFMQQGHSMYLSSLGARNTENDESPQTYLLLYADESAPRRDGAGSVDFCSSPGSESTIINSWRLSRFVGRLNDAGVARLAALRNFERMKKFNHFLRSIEARLQDVVSTAPKAAQLRSIDADLASRARLLGESAQHRSLRAKYYQSQIRRLTDDMGIIPIPGFQDYRQFVRRYLSQSIEVISSVGDRYDQVVRQINVKYNIANFTRTVELQQIAEMVACVLLLYYILGIGDYVLGWTEEILRQPDFMNFAQWRPVIGLSIFMLSYLLLSAHAYRVLRELDASDAGRKSILVAAGYAFAFPWALFDLIGRWLRRLAKTVVTRVERPTGDI